MSYFALGMPHILPHFHTKTGSHMVVYHVTTLKKLNKYLRSGGIEPPVRAWVDIEQAERFSKSTGRMIILRLKFPANAEVLEGHYGKARVLRQRYVLRCL